MSRDASMVQISPGVPRPVTSHSGWRSAAPAQGVVGRVLVGLREGRIVVAGLDEEIGARSCQKGGQADVDQLRCLLADHVDAEKAHVLATEQKLQQPAAVSDDLA